MNRIDRLFATVLYLAGRGLLAVPRSEGDAPQSGGVCRGVHRLGGQSGMTRTNLFRRSRSA